MKVIFLNTWNANRREDLSEYIRDQAEDTDVFCLSEVYDRVARKLCDELLSCDFDSVDAHKDLDDSYFSLVTYWRKDLTMLGSDVLLQNTVDTGLALVTKFNIDEEDVHVCNVHGAPHPGNKLDTPARIDQSRDIVDYFKNVTGPKIIGGDFNLDPETDSINILEKAGYRNLIKDYRIKTTRNHLAWDRYPDNKQMYADFAFMPPDLEVKDFSVPDNSVSDHLPLELKVSV